MPQPNILPRPRTVIAALCACMLLAIPSFAFSPAVKASSSVSGAASAARPAKATRVTDADLKVMARKLQCARTPGTLRKTGPIAPSALSTTLMGRPSARLPQFFGKATPPAAFI